MSKFAFIFPGQGSQTVGMLAALAQSEPEVAHTFEQASEALGYNLWELVQVGPAEKLNETTYTQVAMLSADVAVYRVIQKHLSLTPSMMAGHSLGEYAALVCANALNFKDAVHLVSQRAQLMQAKVPLGEGAMAAIVGLDDEQVQSLCQNVSTPTHQVMPANYNAIGQVVVAGHDKAVEAVINASEAAGARIAKKIPVSVPCHCNLLKGAANAFSQVLNQTSFQVPECTVLSNIDAKPYLSEAHIRTQLADQLYQPVQWVKSIQAMALAGCQSFIEVGPGQVLSGLIRRIDRNLTAFGVSDLNGLEKLQDLQKK